MRDADTASGKKMRALHVRRIRLMTTWVKTRDLAARLFFGAVGPQVREEAFAQLVFFALVQFLFYFFQSKVHDVMMVQFFRSDVVAEAQPQAVEQIDFVGGEIRRVGTKDFVNLVAVGEMDFEIELRLGIRKFFPGVANLPCLLFALVLA